MHNHRGKSKPKKTSYEIELLFLGGAHRLAVFGTIRRHAQPLLCGSIITIINNS